MDNPAVATGTAACSLAADLGEFSVYDLLVTKKEDDIWNCRLETALEVLYNLPPLLYLRVDEWWHLAGNAFNSL
jgi:hypothetical protein